MKLNRYALALGCGLNSVIFYLAFCFLFAVTPTFTVNILSYIVHADLTVFNKVFDWGNFFIGLVAIFIIGYLFGWVLALIYNKFLKEQ